MMMLKRMRLYGPWMIGFLFLSMASLIAGSSDLRLVEAAEKGDRDGVRSLLGQSADANARQVDGTTALHWAAQRDELETARLLVEAGADVNAANDYGVTPLSLACTNGSVAMIQELLKAGADPNSTTEAGETAVMTAARTGNLEAVKALLALGSDLNQQEARRGQTALMLAIEQDHPPIARLLIQRGADVNARSTGGFTPLLFAAQQGDLDSMQALLAAGAQLDGITPEWGSALVVAAARGHEEIALFLLEQGADPNAADINGISSLHYSALSGLASMGGIPIYMKSSVYVYRPTMMALVKELLARGANPNARMGHIEYLPGMPAITPKVGMAGVTPIMLAAAAPDSSLARVLLERGADPLLVTERQTTGLMIAAGLAFKRDRPTKEHYDEALEVAKLFLERGADVNGVGENGWTALHGAAYNGADDLVRWLVENGAQLDPLDDFLQTPWSVAEGLVGAAMINFELKAHTVHLQTAKLLLELGADRSVVPGVTRSDLVPRDSSR